MKKWKISDTARCSYCFEENETIEHLFCSCTYAITLYRNIEQWCQPFNVEMPSNTYENIVLYNFLNTESFSYLHCHLILIYKMLLYNSRSDPTSLNMHTFVNRVKITERTEYRIAKKKDKIMQHLRKWAPYTEGVNT